VHRDIRPSNLILDRGRVSSGDPASRPQPQLKILDLELALLRAEVVNPKEMTASGQMKGTADYMAPEQFTDSHSVDIRADIYSLGCTLYKLLSGHAPFDDARYNTPMERLLGRLTDPPKPIRALRPEIPAALAALIDRQVGPLESFTNGNLIESLSLSPGGDRLLVGEGYGWMFLRDEERGQKTLLGQNLGQWYNRGPQWLPDGRRFVGADLGRVQTFDVGTNRRLGTLFPRIEGDKKSNWLCVSPEGHYRGGPLDRPASPEQPDEGTDPAGLAEVEQHIVYVAQLDDGSNVTFSPEEFRAKFGWQNDPNKARLLQLDQ